MSEPEPRIDAHQPRHMLGLEALRFVIGLKPKLRTVLVLRFGLDGEEPLTLNEIGRFIGRSRERVRQLEQLALRHLRHSMFRNDPRITTDSHLWTRRCDKSKNFRCVAPLAYRVYPRQRAS